MLTLCSFCRRKIFSQQFRRTLCQTSSILQAETSRKDPNSFSWKTHSCGELSPSQIGQSVTLCGWIQHKRYDFMVTVRDAYGVTQVVLPKDNQNELLNKTDSFEDVHLESVVMVTGKVHKRPEGLINPKMLTGEIEVIADKIKVLNPCKETLPIHVHDFQQAKEALRMQYRYLDLRSHRMQHNLRLRSQVVMRMREFLCNNHGFVDVETPSLFRKTPGGAKEYLVPTHQPGKFYTLPQSPQQFKQLLMIGGIDRYFQIARCYRDEGSRPDRQPEFTQVDIEMSFVDKENIYALVEGLLDYSWPTDRPKLKIPFSRLSYSQAMNEYGSDKPDTRFDMKIIDITETAKDCGPLIFAPNGEDYTIRAINCIGAMEYFSNKDYESLQQEVKKHFKQGILIIKCQDDHTWRSPITKHLPESTQLEMTQVLGASAGDVLLIAAGAQNDVCKVLGEVRLLCADYLERKSVPVRDPNAYQFLWVEDFPLFVPSDDGAIGELESSHHPFTAPIPQHANLMYTDPLQVTGQHYDLVLNGSEIGGGSIRIHDARLQEYVLNKILKKDASCLQHLLDALQSGCPPHGGIALGLDRLISIMCGEASIRDVIAFPKTAEGNDPMSGAPSSVEDCDLDRYHIRVVDAPEGNSQAVEENS